MGVNHADTGCRIVQQQLFATPQEMVTSDDYYTPPHIFETLNVRFDVDVCAPPGGIAWIPADHYLTQAENALITPWVGNVWLNPPFSNPTPFVAKFVEHGHGIALVPTSIGRWFYSLWQTDARIVALESVKFYNASTMQQMKQTIPLRCWLVAFGANNVKAIGKFGKVR